ncbi:MAG: tetratricopeptide repeat protein [Kofleriaceae bacterium]
MKRAERGCPVYLSTAGRIADLLQVPLTHLLADDSAASTAEARQPTVAVLPFDLDGQGPDARTFASGLTDDLITRISRFWFPVISLASLAGEPAAPGGGVTGGGKVEAEYLVTGTVRVSGSRVRVSAELAEVATGQVLWRRRYERDLSCIFDVQDDLTADIVAGMEPTLLDRAAQHVRDRARPDLDAWQQAMLATWHFYRRTAADNEEARQRLSDAVRRDPQMLQAWYALALTHHQELMFQWSSDAPRSLSALTEVAAEMRRLHPNESRTQVVLAYLDLYAGRRPVALERVHAAIEDDPNLARAYVIRGIALFLANDPDPALEQLETGLKLSPLDTDRWTFHTMSAYAHFAAERYELAIGEAQRATLHRRSNLPDAHGLIASAHGHLGNLLEARATLDRMRASPAATGSTATRFLTASIHPDVLSRYVDGLQRGGLSSMAP